MKFFAVTAALTAFIISAHATHEAAVSTVSYSANCPTATPGDVTVTRAPVPTPVCGGGAPSFSVIPISGSNMPGGMSGGCPSGGCMSGGGMSGGCPSGGCPSGGGMSGGGMSGGCPSGGCMSGGGMSGGGTGGMPGGGMSGGGMAGGGMTGGMSGAATPRPTPSQYMGAANQQSSVSAGAFVGIAALAVGLGML